MCYHQDQRPGDRSDRWVRLPAPKTTPTRPPAEPVRLTDLREVIERIRNYGGRLTAA